MYVQMKNTEIEMCWLIDDHIQNTGLLTACNSFNCRGCAGYSQYSLVLALNESGCTIPENLYFF
jgi:hypothetical protein